jgi:hypothetical protein
MKRALALLLAVSAAACSKTPTMPEGPPPDAAMSKARGNTAYDNLDATTAHSAFGDAIAADPNDAESRWYHVITALVVLADQPAVQNLLMRAGARAVGSANVVGPSGLLAGVAADVQGAGTVTLPDQVLHFDRALSVCNGGTFTAELRSSLDRDLSSRITLVPQAGGMMPSSISVHTRTEYYSYSSTTPPSITGRPTCSPGESIALTISTQVVDYNRQNPMPIAVTLVVNDTLSDQAVRQMRFDNLNPFRQGNLDASPAIATTLATGDATLALSDVAAALVALVPYLNGIISDLAALHTAPPVTIRGTLFSAPSLELELTGADAAALEAALDGLLALIEATQTYDFGIRPARMMNAAHNDFDNAATAAELNQHLLHTPNASNLQTVRVLLHTALGAASSALMLAKATDGTVHPALMLRAGLTGADLATLATFVSDLDAALDAPHAITASNPTLTLDLSRPVSMPIDAATFTTPIFSLDAMGDLQATDGSLKQALSGVFSPNILSDSPPTVDVLKSLDHSRTEDPSLDTVLNGANADFY